MAELIQDKMYQVAIGGRWNFSFIHAENEEDLIRFLAEHYPNKDSIYGATEICKDGTTRTARLISHPLFETLYAENEARDSTQYLPAGITMIRNRPWAVLLPTANAEPGFLSVWDEFKAVIRVEDDMSHAPATLCLDSCSSNRPVLRGGPDEARDPNQTISSSLRSTEIGYRPVLMPLDPETLEPRPSFLLGRNDGDMFRMGSLYMNGISQLNPQDPTQAGDLPQYYPGARVHIGDSSPNPEDWITWIKAGNVLVSDRVLMNHISFDDLTQMGLVYGPQHNPHSKKPFEQLLENAQRQAAATGVLSKRREASIEK